VKQPPRVLIVDDEPNIVLSLEFLLRQRGIEVAVARDGESALAAVEATPPDVVLLDVMLPGIDGYEVCRRLRADPRLVGMRIVLLTARGREVERVRGLEEGADLYVTKPFSTQHLMAEVERLLGERSRG
jgi:DNA-binding response OmpR family regulator